jgi:predicted  nucleic acid-binding Zn-ribbon protein
MKMLERRLQMLFNNKTQLGQQSKKVEKKLNPMMGSIKSHADAEKDRMAKECTDLKNKLDAITKAMSQNHSVLKSALMSEAEVSRMRKKMEEEENSDFFSFIFQNYQLLSPLTSNPSAALLNSVLSNGDGPGQSVTSVANMSAQLQHQAWMINDLAQKVALLSTTANQGKAGRENRELLDEVRAVRDKNTTLAQEVAVLQAENKKLRKDVGDVKGKDLKQLEDAVKKMSADVSSAKSDATADKLRISTLERFMDKMGKFIFQFDFLCTLQDLAQNI